MVFYNVLMMCFGQLLSFVLIREYYVVLDLGETVARNSCAVTCTGPAEPARASQPYCTRVCAPLDESMMSPFRLSVSSTTCIPAPVLPFAMAMSACLTNEMKSSSRRQYPDRQKRFVLLVSRPLGEFQPAEESTSNRSVVNHHLTRDWA